jgi:hypothetical protein
MNITAVVILGIIFLTIIMIMISLFTMPFNDFLEKTVKKTVWLWLPFHALKRLCKEFREKYMK